LLRARGHEVVIAPLLRIESVDFELPDKAWSAVVMTSANAARAVADHPRRETITALEVFTVGRHTAEAARAAGFRTVHSADGDKDDLADLLRACLGEHSAPLLYLAGEERDGDLAVGGAPIATVIAYRAVKAERFAPAGPAATETVRIDNDLYVRDYSRCILCYKCVSACGEDHQNTFAIAVAGRGFDAHISTELDVTLPDSACVYCGNCIAVCPTGALMSKSEYDRRQAGTWDELGEDVIGLMRDIKKVFDPHNLMNPGKVVTLS